MSGTRITNQQVRLYMNNREHHTQEVAAAKAGMSSRTARRGALNAMLDFRPRSRATIGALALIRLPKSGRVKCCPYCAVCRA